AGARVRGEAPPRGSRAGADFVTATGGCDRATERFFWAEVFCARIDDREPRTARETHLANDTRNLDARGARCSDCLLRYRAPRTVLCRGACCRSHCRGRNHLSRPPCI